MGGIKQRRERMNYDKIINVNGLLKNDFEFLYRATEGSSAEALQYIRIEENESNNTLLAVATNGRRLHKIEPLHAVAQELGISPGLWEVLKEKKEFFLLRLDQTEPLGFTYPDWRKVIPASEPLYSTDLLLDGHDLASNSARLTRFLRSFPEEVLFNFEYLLDLGKSTQWSVSWYGQGKPVKFTSSIFEAVIMTMSTEA
jgi:hypothetical protein